jgi:antitoxin VapB
MGAERHVKLFRNGRNQAVRIPREFELPGEDAIMRREGERLVIEPVERKKTIPELLEWLRAQPPLGPEDDVPEIDDPPPKPIDLFDDDD